MVSPYKIRLRGFESYGALHTGALIAGAERASCDGSIQITACGVSFDSSCNY